MEACEPAKIVTSADVDARLAPFYERVGAAPGLLASLAGISERREWPVETSFMDAAAMAGEKAISSAGIDRGRIGLLVDTSVCRERLEPSSAVTVHNQLDLPSSCTNFDIANACLGFINGMHVAGCMIEAGQIDYALIVDGEGTREIYDNTINRLLDSDTTHEDLFSNFASLTLGSGSAAMVMGRHSENPGSHKVVGGFFHAATEHHDLCVGSLEQMRTDTRALLDAGTGLAKIAWDFGGAKESWLEKDRYILHQVSMVHTEAMIAGLGLPSEKVPMTFPHYGNIGPAAIPITLAAEQDSLVPGDEILCLGIGSGLNAALIELQW
ncbi:MAG: 3-oxoacyl-ACP synthase III [Acidimicrobiales bacterium]